MRLLYDPVGDVLDVIFDEKLHRAEKIAYSLRLGFVLYLTVDSMKPIQVTIVNFKLLTELPAIPFDGWKKLKASDKEQLLPILNSPPVCNFLKLDPNPGVVEVFSAAA